MNDHTGLTDTTLFRIEERLRANEERTADKISSLEQRREDRDIRLDARLDSIATHLEHNNTLLDEHMRRTAQVEEQHTVLNGRFAVLELERHRIRMLLGFFGALLGASGTIAGILKSLGKF